MVYVTGDTHGDISFFKDPKLKKLTDEDILIVCGDFGFLWDRSDKEKKALRTLEKKKYTIDKKTFFCMGGGESDDREMRTEGETWWKEEMPSAEELMNGARNLKDNDFKVDYVITHEAPAIAKDFIRLHKNQEMRLTPLNTYLQELMKSVEYNHWFFGSLHMDLNISKKMTAVFNDIIKIR